MKLKQVMLVLVDTCFSVAARMYNDLLCKASVISEGTLLEQEELLHMHQLELLVGILAFASSKQSIHELCYIKKNLNTSSGNN